MNAMAEPEVGFVARNSAGGAAVCFEPVRRVSGLGWGRLFFIDRTRRVLLMGLCWLVWGRGWGSGLGGGGGALS